MGRCDLPGGGRGETGERRSIWLHREETRDRRSVGLGEKKLEREGVISASLVSLSPSPNRTGEVARIQSHKAHMMITQHLH